MRAQYSFLIFIFLAAFSSVWGQKVSVKGILTDDNNIAVPYANVVFTNVEDAADLYGVMSDEDGSFNIDLKRARYIMELSVIGAKPQSKTLDLTDSKKDLNLGVIVINTVVELKEVTVSGMRPVYQMDLDKKTYNVSGDLLAKASNLSDVMESLPSIQVEVDGAISLRGDQNVKILINGRPNSMTSTVELLKTIPASSIEKIEVISSPSAKYTAEGTGGIINVILKKGSKKGVSGNVELFGGYPMNLGTNVNLNWSRKNSSVFINTGLGYSKPKTIYRVFVDDFDETPTTSTQKSDRERGQLYYLFNSGFSKNINKKNTILGSVTYQVVDANNNSFTDYEDFIDNNSLYGTSYRKEAEEESRYTLQGNLGYNLNFDKENHALSFTYNLDYSNGDQNAVIDDHQLLPSELLGQDRSANDEKVFQQLGSINYTYPFNKNNKLEIGVQTDFFNIKNDFLVESRLSGEWIQNPDFTNQANFQQNIYAAYSQYSKAYEKFSYMLGLRTETTTVRVDLKDRLFSKNYTDLFPSASFNYKFNENESLQLALARRISRPSNWMLIPFFSFTDDRNIYVGNLDIAPSYVYSAELGYSNRLSDKLRISPTVYYRQTSNEKEIYVEKQNLSISEENDGFIATLVNIGDYYAYGGEVGLAYDPVNWCSMYGEVTFNGFKQVGSYKDADFDGQGVLIYGRYNLSLSLLKSLKIQIQNNYRGPIETGQYRRKGIYRMNIGASVDLMKKKATITFNVRDVFNSGFLDVTTFGTDFTRELEVQYRTRQSNISFTYRFNQQKQDNKGSQYDDFDPVN